MICGHSRMEAKSRKPARRSTQEALANRRAAFADKVFPKLQAGIKKELAAQVDDASKLVARGVAIIPDSTKKKWRFQMERAYRQLMAAMMQHGYEIAGADLGKGSKSELQDYRAKAVGIGDAANFLQSNEWAAVDKWVKTTALSVSETSSSRLQRLISTAAGATDEKGNGLTPTQIAKQIFDAGLAQTEARAEMLAHTATIWAYNESAMIRYADEGVAVVEWLTADDDLTCPFCAAMNGKRVETQAAFFNAGDKLALDAGTLKIPDGARGFDIQHPPLHPNCRCTLLPIVDERQLEQ